MLNRLMGPLRSHKARPSVRTPSPESRTPNSEPRVPS
jgi:hypothetical protein